MIVHDKRERDSFNELNPLKRGVNGKQTACATSSAFLVPLFEFRNPEWANSQSQLYLIPLEVTSDDDITSSVFIIRLAQPSFGGRLLVRPRKIQMGRYCSLQRIIGQKDGPG